MKITFWLTLVLATLAWPTAAQTPRLVKDINLQCTGATHSDPDGPVCRVGQDTYFYASNQSTGRELYVTRGTPATTRLVKDLAPGKATTRIWSPVAFKGALWFLTGDATRQDWRLWRCDGTPAGTTVFKDFSHPAYTALPILLGALDKRLVFLVQPLNAAARIWATDGSAAGSGPVTTVPWSPLASSAWAFGWTNHMAVFKVGDHQSGWKLWRTDGTRAGTVVVDPRDFREHSPLATAGNLVYFRTWTTLWRTDGTAAGTLQLGSIQDKPGWKPRTPVASLGGSILFASYDPTFGNELWISDGSVKGTRRLKDINPTWVGPRDSHPDDFCPVGGRLFFTADDNVHGRELWVTDGTTTGTVMVKDQVPGAGGITAANLFSFGGRCLIHLGGSTWLASDGTTAGTVTLPAPSPSGVCFGVGTGYLLLRISQVVTGSEPWAWDGTANPPILLANIQPEVGMTAHGVVTDPVDFFGRTVFGADDGVHGREPWISDGTAAGTRILKDIWKEGAHSYPTGFTVFGNRFFFWADDGVQGCQPWVSDGTASGTVRLKNVGTVVASLVQPGLPFGDRLLFVAPVATGGLGDLWITDGTPGGTHLLQTRNVGYHEPIAGVAVGGTLVYGGWSQGLGSEPWVTDGTPGGTRTLKDTVPGAQSGYFSSPVLYRGAAYFKGGNNYGRGQVWKSDGTSAGTVMLTAATTEFANPVVFKDRLYFMGWDATAGKEMWVTDGTAAGTRRFADNAPGTQDGGFRPGVVSGDRLYFTAADSYPNDELWITDGTPAGTRMVIDLNGPIQSSGPRNMVPLSGNRLLYTASVPFQEFAWWISDGTATGTRALWSTPLYTYLSLRSAPCVSRGRVLFTAYSMNHGIELFTLDPGAMVQEVGVGQGGPLHLAGGFPVLGGTAPLRVSGIPTAGGALLLFGEHGFPDELWPGVYAFFDHLRPLMAVPVGASGLNLPIPNDPALIGSLVVAQAFAYPAVASPHGFSNSGGLYLTPGR